MAPKPKVAKELSANERFRQFWTTDQTNPKIAGSLAWLKNLASSGKNIDETEFESGHDWIQLSFPNRLPSKYNSKAPTLNETRIDFLKEDNGARDNFKATLKLTMNLYGIDFDSDEDPVEFKALEKNKDGKVTVDGVTFTPSKKWLEKDDHNHLRLTRIMHSCNDLGFKKEAKALQKYLLDHCSIKPDNLEDALGNDINASEETKNFWKNAAPEDRVVIPKSAINNKGCKQVKFSSSQIDNLLTQGTTDGGIDLIFYGNDGSAKTTKKAISNSITDFDIKNNIPRDVTNPTNTKPRPPLKYNLDKLDGIDDQLKKDPKKEPTQDVTITKAKPLENFEEILNRKSSKNQINCIAKDLDLFGTTLSPKDKTVDVHVDFGNCNNFGGSLLYTYDGAQEENALRRSKEGMALVLAHKSRSEGSDILTLGDHDLYDEDKRLSPGRGVVIEGMKFKSDDNKFNQINLLAIAAPKVDGGQAIHAHHARPNELNQDIARYLFLTSYNGMQTAKDTLVKDDVNGVRICSGLWGAGVFKVDPFLSLGMQALAAGEVGVELVFSNKYQQKYIDYFVDKILPELEKIAANVELTIGEKIDQTFNLCKKHAESDLKNEKDRKARTALGDFRPTPAKFAAAIKTRDSGEDEEAKRKKTEEEARRKAKEEEARKKAEEKAKADAKAEKDVTELKTLLFADSPSSETKELIAAALVKIAKEAGTKYKDLPYVMPFSLSKADIFKKVWETKYPNVKMPSGETLRDKKFGQDYNEKLDLSGTITITDDMVTFESREEEKEVKLGTHTEKRMTTIVSMKVGGETIDLPPPGLDSMVVSGLKLEGNPFGGTSVHYVNFNNCDLQNLNLSQTSILDFSTLNFSANSKGLDEMKIPEGALIKNSAISTNYEPKATIAEVTADEKRLEEPDLAKKPKAYLEKAKDGAGRANERLRPSGNPKMVEAESLQRATALAKKGVIAGGGVAL